MTHNVEPKSLGYMAIDCDEMLFYTYLPVKLRGQANTRVPRRLECFTPLISAARAHFSDNVGHDFDWYIYLTAKSLYVTPQYIGGREGWHIDGFGTDDKNYIWSDRLETEFCVQDFSLSDDCNVSMLEMEKQSNPANVRTFGEGVILALTTEHVHRCPKAPNTMRRTFAKVSFSKDRYDLKGNSHNDLLDYRWHMFERDDDRNHPTFTPLLPKATP